MHPFPTPILTLFTRRLTNSLVFLIIFYKDMVLHRHLTFLKFQIALYFIKHFKQWIFLFQKEFPLFSLLSPLKKKKQKFV